MVLKLISSFYEKRFVPLIALIFLVPLPSQNLSAQTSKITPQSSIHKTSAKATYSATEGGDLNRLIQRKATIDGEGFFTIQLTGELPKKNAKLSINAYDIDEERGETVKIYLNGYYTGKLSGTNNSWNTSLLDIKPSWLKLGPNLVRILVTDTSRSKTIKWSSKISWGQLLIDGGAGDKAYIVDQALDYNEKENTYKALSTVKVTAIQSGDFRLEVSLIDAKANSIASNTHQFSSDKGETTRQDIDLKITQAIPVGNYNLLANLFYKQDGTWIQQVYEISPWEHQKEKKIKPTLQLKAPIQDIELAEDAPATTIDLEKVFKVVDANNDNLPLKQAILTTRIINNTNKELASTAIKNNQLTIDYMPEQHGKAIIHVLGQYKKQKITDIFNIMLKSVDDPPIVSLPINDVLVDENSNDTNIDIHRTFNDPDNDDRKILKRIKSNSNPQLVTAKVIGDELVLSYSKNSHGSADITLEGFSNSLSANTRFKVIVYPAEKEEKKSMGDKDNYYAKAGIGTQSVKTYENAAAINLTLGKQLDSILDGLAVEFHFASTLTSHERVLSSTSGGSTTYETAKLDITAYTLFAVYEFFKQKPERFSLFVDNPIKTRFKLGYSAIRYTLGALSSPFNADQIDNNLRSQTTHLSYGIEIAASFKSDLESYLEYTQTTSNISNIGIGARFYY